MEEPEPQVFFTTVLRDPLSEVTRKERVYLLGTSTVGIAILKTGLVPTQITALGIEFDRANQETFLLMWGLVVLYFLFAFIVYAASDFLAWWEGYLAAQAEVHMPQVRFFRKLEEQLKELHETLPEDLSEEQRREQEHHMGQQLIGQRWAEVETKFARLRRTRKTGRTVATIRALIEYLFPLLLGAYAAYILIL